MAWNCRDVCETGCGRDKEVRQTPAGHCDRWDEQTTKKSGFWGHQLR
jgi:hypothetical protein